MNTFIFYLLGVLALFGVLGILADYLPHTPDRDDFNGEDEL
ncbi:hypothetical protein AB0284_21525 [Pseudarthrobacter phenanthrenivorans]